MIKRVVSNTGPMIALDGIGELDLLRNLFDEVMIPRAVYDELIVDNPKISPAREAFRVAEWIKIMDLSHEPEPLLFRMLDAGEASVIKLASDSDSLVLMDEKKGRKIAGDIYDLPVIGTAGLLILAKRTGLIQAAMPLLESIRNNGYWIDEAILRFAKQETNE